MMLLADESVDRMIVERLRADGHDTLYVAEMSPGITDDEILREASSRNALLLTEDKDFGELVYRLGRAHSTDPACRSALVAESRYGWKSIARPCKRAARCIQRDFTRRGADSPA